jgi:predicted RNA-binding Zn-ribbon protein involved in translation (DUF1610 family)
MAKLDPVTYEGELESAHVISMEMRDRFLDHYVSHDNCEGYHSCTTFREMRRRWAAGRQGLEILQDEQDTCPQCGDVMLRKTNRMDQSTFYSCRACRYTKSSR